MSKDRSDTFEDYINRDTGTDCWEWTGGRTLSGYGRYRSQPAHRVSFERSNGAIPDGMYILHGCDNPPCVNPAHLRVGTAADNFHDMISRGRARLVKPRNQRGENNPRAKLTVDEVRQVRALRGIETRAAIARRFGISKTSVTFIQARKCWPHVL